MMTTKNDVLENTDQQPTHSDDDTPALPSCHGVSNLGPNLKNDQEATGTCTTASNITKNLAAASIANDCDDSSTQSQSQSQSPSPSSDYLSPNTPTPDITATLPATAKKGRREICTRCHRPKPRACICHALPPPDRPLELKDTVVVILQHPHEFKHKNNRSVPLLELCFSSSSSPSSPEYKYNNNNNNNNTTTPLHLCVGRRLGDRIPLPIRELLEPPHLPILIFPETNEEGQLRAGRDDDVASAEHNNNANVRQVYSLTELGPKILEWKREQQQQQQQQHHVNVTDTQKNGKVVLLVLDATWKFAKEMHRANHNHYPPHMLRMALQPDDLPKTFRPSRFEIRTTPSQDNSSSSSSSTPTRAWMCTAECVSWILSQLEQTSQPQNLIYETVLRAIDAAVEKHNSFIRENKEKNRQRKNNIMATGRGS